MKLSQIGVFTSLAFMVAAQRATVRLYDDSVPVDTCETNPRKSVKGFVLKDKDCVSTEAIPETLYRVNVLLDAAAERLSCAVFVSPDSNSKTCAPQGAPFDIDESCIPIPGGAMATIMLWCPPTDDIQLPLKKEFKKF